MPDRRLPAALRDRLPELVVLAVGIVLRATMLSRFDPARGYDFSSHWKYIGWFLDHTALPGGDYSRATYHPPLYYFAVAQLRRLGLPAWRVATLSVVAGALRLVLFAAVLRRFFPRQRLARVVALALAAVLPASIHIDGMVNPEAWLGLFSAAFLSCAALAFAADGARRWRWALAAGACAALGLLTKVSILTLVAAVAVAALAEAAATRPWRDGARRLAPFVAALALAGAASGWYFARNQRLYGHPVLTGYDFRDRNSLGVLASVPPWRRRPLGYLVGWSSDIYRRPTWPAGYQPVPRFFPVLIASTFADYYRYGFAPEGTWNRELPNMPTRPTWYLALASIAGGTVIAAFTVAAWLVAAWLAVRRRRCAALALLLAPLFALAGQLWFAWAYPNDLLGPVKGVYLQFAALPLCALFGLAIGALWNGTAARRVLAIMGIVALLPVAAYSGYGRFAAPRFVPMELRGF